MSLNEAELAKFLADVRRAPSPHNTQPIRWRIVGDSIELVVEAARILDVSDREHRDLDLSAGAATALARLALRDLGYEIRDWKVYGSRTPKSRTSERLVYATGALAKTSPATEPDLETWRRHACFRGKFGKSSERPLPTFRSGDVRIVADAGKKKAIAALYDESLAFFLGRPDYANELWSWLRLSRNHPDFDRDGLNTEALRLGPVLAFFSRFIMKPSTLAFLSKLGIVKPLVSEAPQNLSAEGFLLLVGAPGASSFDRGAEIVRTWMDLERAGRFFCPVTSLIDDPKFHRELAKIAGLPEGTAIYHVCRFGPLPPKETTKLAPRLPASEIAAGN
jgi:hypothetical protein